MSTILGIKFRSTFHVFGIQVQLEFVVIINIWIVVCFTIFICQFGMLINELSTNIFEFCSKLHNIFWIWNLGSSGGGITVYYEFFISEHLFLRLATLL